MGVEGFGIDLFMTSMHRLSMGILLRFLSYCYYYYYYHYYVGCGGALVKSMTLNWRVVGSTPAPAAT